MEKNKYVPNLDVTAKEALSLAFEPRPGLLLYETVKYDGQAVRAFRTVQEAIVFHEKMYVSKYCEYSISKNTFTSNEQSLKKLHSVNNIVAVIDIADERLKRDGYAKAYSALWQGLYTRLLKIEGIPFPNFLVEVGSKVYLWWCFEPNVARYYYAMYVVVKNALLTCIDITLSKFCEFKGMHLDMEASADDAGLVMMPGTYNPKTGHQACIRWLRRVPQRLKRVATKLYLNDLFDEVDVDRANAAALSLSFKTFSTEAAFGSHGRDDDDRLDNEDDDNSYTSDVFLADYSDGDENEPLDY